jgi:hypothetical protein
MPDMNEEENAGHTNHHHEHHRPVPFTVDREPQLAHAKSDTKADEAHLTVKEVLDMSGNQPPEDFYLVQYEGEHHHHQIKHDNLTEVLTIRPHARFSAVYKGPTQTT